MRVSLDALTLFGDRRWVIDANGKLVERYGPGSEGDTTGVRTIPGFGDATAAQIGERELGR
ncbi:MAG: hypothetical protein ACJ768_12755 [Gaiellaceae bacterium]